MINIMANGQVVLVTTERLEGGAPMRAIYYVAEEDPTKAEAIVAAVMAPNEKVEARSATRSRSEGFGIETG